MRHLFTKKPFRDWGQPSPIDPASQGLKNSSSKQRGQDCEQKACSYFLDQGYKLIAKNKKIYGVEVDILLFAEHYLMVEVKSLSSEEEISFRLGKKQRQRLEWARDYLISTSGEIVLLKVVFVTKENKLIILDIEDFY